MMKSVRLADVGDAEELSRLNQEFNGGDRIPTSKIIESLAHGNELIAVVTLNGNVVGFACGQSFKSFCYIEVQGEITEFYVEEKARRMGLASSLIAFLEEQLVLRGVKNIKILTGKDNSIALHTYLRSNYIIDDTVVLQKKI